MKPNRISPQAVVAVCALPIMAFCPSLSAQNFNSDSGAEQNVTLTVIETYTDASLKPRDENGKTYNDDLVYENEWSTEKFNSNDDPIEESANYEYGAKQVTLKISNKELIEALIDEEIISSPIAGWAIKFVTPGDDTGGGRFYAVKNGEAIDLSEIISSYGDGYADTESEKWSSKTTYKYDKNGDEIGSATKETWSFSGKWMTNASIIFSFSDSSLYLNGIFNESWSAKSFGKGEGQYWQFAPGAAKFDNGSGSIYFEEYNGEEWVEWSDPSVVKGTISLSAGKLFPNIYLLYPDFEPDYGDDDDED